jgi:enolase
LELIVEAIETAGYRSGIDVMIALDVAANEIKKRTI